MIDGIGHGAEGEGADDPEGGMQIAEGSVEPEGASTDSFGVRREAPGVLPKADC